MTVTSSPRSISSRARFHPTLPAPAMITYKPATSSFLGRHLAGPLPLGQTLERRALELLDRDLRRADGLHALLAVPRRAARVEHARDHARDVEAPLRDLGDDEVRVVAVRGGDEDVGVLDAGLQQGVDLERGADREAPAGLLPGAAELDVEAFVRERILVEHGDGVA